MQAKTEAPEQISEQLSRPVQAKTEAPEQISEQLGQAGAGKDGSTGKDARDSYEDQHRCACQASKEGRYRHIYAGTAAGTGTDTGTAADTGTDTGTAADTGTDTGTAGVQAQIPVQQQSQMPEQSRKYLQPNIQNTNNDDERSLFVKAPEI